MMRFFSRARHSYRQLGDRYREGRDWAAAAQAYRRHLDDDPADAAIWVQLGHAEKEAKRFEVAEAAYNRASELAPMDVDPLLHLAHLLKQIDRTADAIEVFLRLVRISPDQNALAELRELTLLRQHSTRGVTAHSDAFLFTIGDFFSAFTAQTTMTGIQRVEAGILLSLIERGQAELHFVLNSEEDDVSFLGIQHRALRDLIEYVLGPFVDHAVLQGRLIEARLNAVKVECQPGSAIVILGAFWGLADQPSRLLNLKRSGVRVVAFIHDVIPLTHPEYCDLSFSNAFWRSLADLLLIADVILTNSLYTQRELVRVIEEQGGRKVPMQPVPLAHSLSDRPLLANAITERPKMFRQRAYVAYVSTIEGRKNHLYVVQAWQQMMMAGVKVPDLVFVGRHGWKTNELDALLGKTRYLGGRVHIVHGLSDAELDRIYRYAEFTVFTSLAEGWGLPVGESLCLGTPCVASQIASIPEVGGNFVDYVNPSDLDDGVRVLTRMIVDKAYRDERRRNIENNFVPRRWSDVGKDFLETLTAMLRALPAHVLPEPISLPEGFIFRPGDLMGKAHPPPHYFAKPLGLAIAPSFYEPEPAGAWMRGRMGEITFKTSLKNGHRAVLFASIVPAPWAIGSRFCLDVGAHGRQPRWKRLRDGENLFRIECPIGDDSVTLTLHCESEPEPIPGDARRFAISLSAIAYAAIENVQARANLRHELPTAHKGSAA